MKYIKEFKSFEFILEGRYDSITNKISSDVFNYWKQDFYVGKKESRFENSYYTEDIEVEVSANISFIDGFDKFVVDGGVDEESDYLEIKFEIDPSWLPEYFSKVSMWLKDIIRHEIEHLTQDQVSSSYNPAKQMGDDQFVRNLINTGYLDKSDYFRLPKEVDANLQGMYYRAKKERRPFIDVIMEYLNAQNIKKEDIQNILDIWRKRAKELNLSSIPVIDIK